MKRAFKQAFGPAMFVELECGHAIGASQGLPEHECVACDNTALTAELAAAREALKRATAFGRMHAQLHHAAVSACFPKDHEPLKFDDCQASGCAQARAALASTPPRGEAADPHAPYVCTGCKEVFAKCPDFDAYNCPLCGEKVMPKKRMLGSAVLPPRAAEEQGEAERLRDALHELTETYARALQDEGCMASTVNADPLIVRMRALTARTGGAE